MNSYQIGIDGTDSIHGGCTTWTGSRVLDAIYTKDRDINLVTYPRLIRLNPNIPMKTRGNAAIAINIESTLEIDNIYEITKQIIDQDVMQYRKNMDYKAGFLITDKSENPEYYYRALTSQIDNFDDIDLKIAYPEESISLIGSYGAINSDLTKDYTFELIAYRQPKSFGEPRKINNIRLQELSKKYSSTFSSFDFQQNRELICPSGPDPVFCGIRGTDPDILMQFYEELEIEEKIESITIFQTNQGTNHHVLNPQTSLKKNTVFSGLISVIDHYIEISGGHISIPASVGSTEIPIMFFEPTKELRDLSRKLIAGDRVYLHGSIIQDQHGLSIHAEYFQVVVLSKDIRYSSPECSQGHRMTKAGSFSGYKCEKCSEKAFQPSTKEIPRVLYVGQRCYSSLSAQRHLTKPRSRFLTRNELTRKNLKYEMIRRLFTD